MSFYQEISFTNATKDSSLRRGESTRRQMLSLSQNQMSSLNEKIEEITPNTPQISNLEEDGYNTAFNMVLLETNNNIQIENINFEENTISPRLKIIEEKKIGSQLFPLSTQNQISLKDFSDPSGQNSNSPKDTQKHLVNILTSQANYTAQEMSSSNITQINIRRKSNTLSDQIQIKCLENNPLRKKRLKQTETREFNDLSPLKKNLILRTEKLIHSLETNPSKTPKSYHRGVANVERIPINKDHFNQKFQIRSSRKTESSNLTKIWMVQGFMIITLVRKFILKMENLSHIRRFNKQTYHQFQVINDLSAFYDSMRGNLYLDAHIFKQRLTLIKRRILNSFLFAKCLSFFPQKIHSLEPDSYFFIMWVIFMHLMIILVIFINPIFMAFNEEVIAEQYLDEKQLQSVCRIQVVICIIDSVFYFNTAYYQRGIIIKNRLNIALNYIKGKFFFDLLIILTFSIYDLKNELTLLALTFLLIKKILNLKKDLEDAITLPKKERSIYELCKLCLFVLIIAHFCGCLFWFVGKQTSSDGNTSWITSQNLLQSSFSEKYINSLYWASVTMLTVGYGDIIPKNQVEKCVVLLIMIISCGVYAYSLSQIGVLIQQIPPEDGEFKQNFSSISVYMKKRNLEVKIQNEVKRYFQYLSKEKYNFSQDRDIMLNPLNSTLKQKVLMSINLQFLQQYKMFSLHFSSDLLKQLALVMKEQEYMPDDKIWESADIDHQNRIFFVVRGQVRQLVNSQFTVKIIEEGGYFNEKSFVIDEISHVSFISTCVSTLVFLEKKDFTQIIRKFPKDFEIYCKLRDQAKNQDFLSVLDTKCETCEQFTHNFNSCPQVNYKMSQEKFIFQMNQNIKQERKKVDRCQINQYLLLNSNESFNSVIGKSQRIKASLYRNTLLESVSDYLMEQNPNNWNEDTIIDEVRNIIDNNQIKEHLNSNNRKQDFSKKIQFFDCCSDAINKDILSPQIIDNQNSFKNLFLSKLIEKQSSNNCNFIEEKQDEVLVQKESNICSKKCSFSNSISQNIHSSFIDIPSEENIKGNVNESYICIAKNIGQEDFKQNNLKIVYNNISPIQYSNTLFQQDINATPNNSQYSLNENEVLNKNKQNGKFSVKRTQSYKLSNKFLSSHLSDEIEQNNHNHSDRYFSIQDRKKEDRTDFDQKSPQKVIFNEQMNQLTQSNSKSPRNKKSNSIESQRFQPLTLNNAKKNKHRVSITASNFTDQQQKGQSIQSFVEEQSHFDEIDSKIFSDLPNLDKFCIYSYYFPYNNIDKVIGKIKENNMKVQAKKRNQKRSVTSLTKLEKFKQLFNQKINSRGKFKQGSNQSKGKKQKLLELSGASIINKSNQSINSNNNSQIQEYQCFS